MESIEPLKIFQVEPLGRGGIAQYTYCLNQALVKAGALPILVTADKYEWETQADFAVTKLFPLRNRFTRIFRSKKLAKAVKGISFFYGLYRLRKTITDEKPSVLHFQGSLPFTDWMFSKFTFRFAQKRGIRIVYTAHSVLPFEPRPIHERIYRSIYQRADAIIAHSSKDQNELAIFEPKHAPVYVVAHGNYALLDQGQDVDKQKTRSDLGLSHKDKVILFFGTMRPHKGVDNLINACGLIREHSVPFKLLVVGNPVGDFEKYDHLIEQNKLDDSVIKVLGYIPNNEIAGYFSIADILVLPYKRAYQSSVAQLGLTFGLPMICSKVGGLTDLIKDRENGLLYETGDEQALSRLIMELLTDDGLANRLAENNLKKARKHSWAQAASQTLEVYQD